MAKRIEEFLLLICVGALVVGIVFTSAVLLK